MDKNFPRLLEILRLIPKSSWGTASDIHRSLISLGFEISRRTVERDLDALSLHFPIQSDRRSKPYGWRWSGATSFFAIPDLSLYQALALLLLDREFGEIMPAPAREILAPLIQQSKAKISQAGQKRAARWPKKIAFRPLGPPLIPAKTSLATLLAVSDALLNEVQILGNYKSFAQTKYRPVRLHPLGIVRTGLINYLVACIDGYNDPRLFAMHRLKSVRLTDVPIQSPLDFDLDKYLSSGAVGALNFGSGKLTKITFRMSKAAAAHLLETPLSQDQSIAVDIADPDSVIVSATVEESLRLKWWIRGFGDDIQVLTGFEEDWAQP